MVVGNAKLRLFSVTTVTLIAVVLCLLLPQPVAAGLTLYESHYVNNSGFTTYADVWQAQTFTVGTAGHTASMVRVRLERDGTPGYITCSIRETSGGEPDGPDLTSDTLLADSFSTESTWIDFYFDDPIYLEPSTQYALVLRVLGGDSTTNYVTWRSDNTAGEANGQRWVSSTGGTTWTGDATDDYTFAIWGVPGLEVYGAEVYRSYIEDDDWLIVAYYSNVLAPYYPDSNPGRYFSLQLVDDDDTTVLHQTPVRQWGSRPGGVYLSATSAASLEWQEDYRVRIYGNYGANPSDSYTLTAGDWVGSDLDLLDDWCMLTATNMGDIDGIIYTVSIGDEGLRLNEAGGVIFDLGIDSLSDVRGGEIFGVYWHSYEEDAKEFTDITQTEFDYDSRLGSYVTEVMDDGGDTVSLDGKVIGIIGMSAIYLCLASLCVTRGRNVEGIVLAFPCLFLGMALGLIDVAIVAVVASVATMLLVWHLFLRNT